MGLVLTCVLTGTSGAYSQASHIAPSRKTDPLSDRGASFSFLALPGANVADSINLPSILLAMLKMNHTPVGIQWTPLKLLKGPKLLNK